ncbi:MAG TPA: methionyl-tRNA formyltransferase [bacterium]|nr:methionyl-tRNA formyltransferase [bacterium]
MKSLPALVFMGTGSFCVPSLETLAGAGHPILGVITRPGRPAGRGRRLADPPAAVEGRRLGLTVLQPERPGDPGTVEAVRKLAPDLIVAAAYGAYIPAALIESAHLGAINLHPSLLPRYRGAAPVAWALINGDAETGVCVHYLAEEVDAGDVLASRALAIDPEDDRASLEARLARAGAVLLAETAAAIASGTARAVPQDHSRAVAAPRLRKEDGRIDWTLASAAAVNRIRGLHPWPGSFTVLPAGGREREVRILRARAVPGDWGAPGTVHVPERERLVVAAGSGAVEITEIQVPGKKALTAPEFLRGYPPVEGGKAR